MSKNRFGSRDKTKVRIVKEDLSLEFTLPSGLPSQTSQILPDLKGTGDPGVVNGEREWIIISTRLERVTIDDRSIGRRGYKRQPIDN